MKQVKDLKCNTAVKLCPLCNCDKVSIDRVLNGISLLRCSICDFVYANLSITEVEKFNSSYDDLTASRYSSQKSVLDHVWFEQIANVFTKKIGRKRVLDVGCGDCHLLSVFKNKGWECYGIDLSHWSQKLAQINHVEFEHGKIEDVKKKAICLNGHRGHKNKL